MKRILLGAWFVFVSILSVEVALAEPAPFVLREAYEPSFLQKVLEEGVTIHIKGVPHAQIPVYQEQMVAAYNAWFKETAAFIAQQNRQEEFGDLYTRLTQGVNVRFSAANPDLTLYVVPKKSLILTCNDTVVGCVFMDTQPFKLYLSPMPAQNRQAWFSTLLHELGHTLGLDDQYDDPESHNQTVSRIFSSNERDPYGIMGDDENIIHLSADNATGLINAIDRYLPNYYGHKYKKWKSLDTNSADVYQNGKRQGTDRQTHIIHDYASREWRIQRTGEPTQTYRVPAYTSFKSLADFLDIEVTGSTWQPKAPAGNTQADRRIISSYFQGQTNRLFFNGSTLVAADSFTKRKNQTDYVAHIGTNGKVIYLAWIQPKDSDEKTVYYGEDITLPNRIKTFSCPAQLEVAVCLHQHLTAPSVTRQLKKNLGKRK